MTTKTAHESVRSSTGPSRPPRKLGRKVRRGVAWIFAGRGAIVLLHLSATVVLARLLDPVEFGVFGIAQIFVGFGSRMGNAGFSKSLIRHRDLTPDHVSTAFVANGVIYLSAATALYFLSGPIGKLFRSEDAGRALAVLSFGLLLFPSTSVARALIQRALRFKALSLINVCSQIATFALAIALAVLGLGFWSLVWGYLAGKVFRALAILAISGWRPSLRYRHSALRDLLGFSVLVSLKNVLIYFAEKADYFIVGRQLGAAALGLYEKAFETMSRPVRESTKSIAGVLYPAFSELQEDRERLAAAYRKTVMTLSLVTFPALTGLALVAPAFIRVAFGPKWLAAAFPLQVMCLAGMLRMSNELASPLIEALGRVGGELARRIVAFVLLAAACLVGSRWGIDGVAVGVTVATFVLTAAIASYLVHSLGFRWSDILLPQGPALAACAVMAGAVLGVRQLLAGVIEPLTLSSLAVSVATGAVAYPLALWALRVEQVSEIAGELFSALGRRKKRKRSSGAGRSIGSRPGHRAAAASEEVKPVLAFLRRHPAVLGTGFTEPSIDLRRSDTRKRFTEFHRVVVRDGSERARPPRAFWLRIVKNKPPGAIDAALRRQFRTLSRLADRLRGASRPGVELACSEPVALLPDLSCLITAECRGELLNRVLRRALPPLRRRELLAHFRNLGTWLRRYHEIAAPETRREIDPDEAVARYRKNYGEEPPADLVVPALCHNDYSPRNIFVAPGRVEVIDFVGAGPGIAAEDVAFFDRYVERARFNGLYSRRFRRALVAAFHEGYDAR